LWFVVSEFADVGEQVAGFACVVVSGGDEAAVCDPGVEGAEGYVFVVVGEDGFVELCEGEAHVVGVVDLLL
jgi:hypothetical protein